MHVSEKALVLFMFKNLHKDFQFDDVSLELRNRET